MSRKLIIGLAITALLAVGGFLAFQFFQGQQQQAYQQSSDKIADDFINALLAHNVPNAMSLFSPTLRSNYSEQYWKTTIFKTFETYKGEWPVRHFKGAVQPANDQVPSNYDPQLNQQATKYDYDFQIDKSTYRLTLVIFRLDNSWKINEANGDYLP